jgi:hypothetical protein
MAQLNFFELMCQHKTPTMAMSEKVAVKYNKNPIISINIMYQKAYLSFVSN